MADKFIFEFDERGLDRIIQKVEEFRLVLFQIGKSGQLGQGFERFFQEFDIGSRRSTQRISELLAQIQQLQDLAQSVGGQRQLQATIPDSTRQSLREQGIDTTQGATFEAAINERLAQIDAERVQLQTLLANQQERLVQAKEREVNRAIYQNRLETTRANLLGSIRNVQPGGSRLTQLVAQRENELLQRQVQLHEQLAQAIAQSSRAAPQEVTAILTKEVQLTSQIARAKREQAEAERQVAEARAAAQQAGLGRGTQLGGTRTEAETNALLQQQQQLRENLNAARDKATQQATALAVLENQRRQNLQQLAAVESGGTGLSRGATEVLNRLRQVNEQLSILDTSSDALGDVFGEDITGQLREVESILASFEGRDLELLTDEENAQLGNAIQQARQLLTTVERFPQQGIPVRLSEQELLASLGPINRILLGAARDFGRRFTATLQFAISGALLFGAQRLAREFFDAAVEVQRTFADISTALQFDIDAERGTAEFSRQLEGVRRQVLDIADDFNALPTEVNEAAFQMISRFQSIEAAMIATRAQILATRVATIDQSEALRALTAVAEATSLSLSKMSREEREIATATQQLRAVDFATVIQQQFQVPIEDTLEGAAGLAAVLTNLGFTIEEVFAIVATTVLETGQTGQTVTDSLGRAFSQFNTAEIRDELLALANTTDQLTLTPADFFESGRNAFFKIVDDYAEADQQLQGRIDEILGQRRETRFIAGLLGGASEGRLDEILELSGDAAGAAEDRLATLLRTVSGTIEGISQQFQELAQNLSELGIITPIQVFLTTVEAALRVFNALTKTALNFVEALNRIEIPGTDWGLGTVLTTALTLATALASIRGLIRGIQVVADARGARTLIDIFKSFIGLDAPGGGKAASLAGSAGAALGFAGFGARIKEANTLMGKFSTGVSTLFMAPIRGAMGLLQAAQARLYLWNAALIAGSTVTTTATGAETGLSLARARTAIQTAYLTAQTYLTNLSLAGVGSALAGFGSILVRLPGYALAAMGAIFGLQGAFSVISDFVTSLFSDPRTGVDQRTKEIIAQQEAAGEPADEAAARLQAVTERLGQLNKSLEELETSGGGTAATFLAQALAILPGQVGDLLEGGEFGQLKEKAELTIEKAAAEINEVLAIMGNAERELGGDRTQDAPELAEARARLSEIISQIQNFEFDPTTDTLGAYQELVAEAEAIAAQIPGLRDLIEEVVGQVNQWGEVLTPDQIAQAISRLRNQLQLGDTTLGAARRELANLRASALAGLEQATVFGNQEEIDRYTDILLDVRLADQQFAQQELDAALERNQLIEDNRTKLLADLIAIRDFARAAANNPNLGPEAVKQAQEDVLEAERAYNDALLEEAVERAQFEANSARTFRDRIAALKRLLEAIKEQIRQRIAQSVTSLAEVIGSINIFDPGSIAAAAAAAAGIAAAAQATAAEEARIQSVLDQIADEQLRYARLVARNSTLRNKSSLDNVAAIAATANALRAEIRLLKQRGVDEQEILEKEIELRDTLAQQRLAEADRRAAYFRLTAGTGDEIRVAQAELRAAQDRLATITALGGADTQQGYEAELAVLRARENLANLALRQADLSRRVTSDLTDSYEQALLDVQAAQEAARRAAGDLEKLEAEKALREAESRAQREFYDQRLSDLDFLFQTDQIGRSQYIAGLRALQAGIDRTTRQGEELWREIELQIRGLQEDASQAFNIPTEIRLPTLFEVRRAVQADALGTNYQDNRQQEINVYVADEVDAQAVIQAINDTFGGSIDLEAQRLASGGAGITIGGFN